MLTVARNQLIVYLFAFALLFNAITPVLASSLSSNDSTGSSNNNVLNNKVLLCTSQGYQWITLEEVSASQVSEKEPIHCVLCISNDDIANNSTANNSNLRHVLYSKKRRKLINTFPLLQSRYLAQLADNRAPPKHLIEASV